MILGEICTTRNFFGDKKWIKRINGCFYFLTVSWICWKWYTTHAHDIWNFVGIEVIVFIFKVEYRLVCCPNACHVMGVVWTFVTFILPTAQVCVAPLVLYHFFLVGNIAQISEFLSVFHCNVFFYFQWNTHRR